MSRPVLVPPLVALLACAAPAVALQRVYVANINAGAVSVLDADRDQVIGVIAVGKDPDGVCATPKGRAVYVANFVSDSVSVIDTATDTVVATIAVGDGPVGLAATPDGREVYVTNKLAGTVSVIDTASMAVVATIRLGPGQGPNAVAFDPAGLRAFVTSSFQARVSVIHTSSRRVFRNLTVGAEANRIAVSPDGRRAYVTGFARGSLSAIDLDSYAVDLDEHGRVGGEPTAVAVSADNRSVYVVSGTLVHHFDAQTLARLGGAYLGPGGYALAADGERLLVANMPRDEVALVHRELFRPDLYDPYLLRPPPAVLSLGGPFALAALPQRDTPALLAAIDAPPFDFKLDPRDRTAVRVSVGDGTAALARWTVLLRDLDGLAPDRQLAEGTTAVDRAVVASLVAAELRRGGHYAVVLEAVAAGDATVGRQLRFSVPDRRYAMVPLEASVPPVFFTAFEMDDAGARFVRWNWHDRRFELYDATTGSRGPIALPLALDFSDFWHLSDDGGRLAFGGTPSEGGRLFGVFDVDSRVLSLLPYEPFYFDLDTAGRWLAGANIGTSRYPIFDTIDGVRIPLNEVDQENDEDCRPVPGGRPRVSADSALVAFASGIDLGLDAPPGCNVYLYDRPAATLRLVRSLGRTDLLLPSLDDAATTAPSSSVRTCAAAPSKVRARCSSTWTAARPRTCSATIRRPGSTPRSPATAAASSSPPAPTSIRRSATAITTSSCSSTTATAWRSARSPTAAAARPHAPAAAAPSTSPT
jgi:YVTN family beta-propeller protein